MAKWSPPQVHGRIGEEVISEAEIRDEQRRTSRAGRRARGDIDTANWNV
jgi:hypothetical protein